MKKGTVSPGRKKKHQGFNEAPAGDVSPEVLSHRQAFSRETRRVSRTMQGPRWPGKGNVQREGRCLFLLDNAWGEGGFMERDFTHK